jgi:dolichol kinase
MAVRFTFFEAVYAILVAGAGLVALAADRLGLEWLKNVGITFISVMGLTDAKRFFSEHNGIVIAMVGIMVTAWGAGSATTATYRYGQLEKPNRRLADRIAAIALIIPLGLGISGWGIMKTFAPTIAASAKAATLEWLGAVVKRIADGL